MNSLSRCGEILVSDDDERERYEIHCLFCKKAFNKFPGFVNHRKKSCITSPLKLEISTSESKITEFEQQIIENESVKMEYGLALKDSIINDSPEINQTDKSLDNNLQSAVADNINKNTEIEYPISDGNFLDIYFNSHLNSNETDDNKPSDILEESNLAITIANSKKDVESCSEKILSETMSEDDEYENSDNEQNYQPMSDNESECSKINEIVEDKKIPSVINKRNPFKCPQCSNVLTTRKGVERHICAKPKTYVCKICGKIVKNSTRQNFMAHVKTHSEARNFVCSICSCDFKTSAHLSGHQKVHEREKKFECEFCGSKYKFKSSLNKHVKYVHLGVEKPHKCEQCNYRFEEKKDLRYHLDKIHGIKIDYTPKPPIRKHIYHELDDPERIYKCQVCPAKFKTFQSTIEHRKKLHNMAFFQCDCCELTFIKYLDYQRHKFKPYKCSYCRIMIRNDKMKESHDCNKEFICELCGKKFLRKESLRIHLLTHGEEKKYSCQMCNMSFKQASSLYSHTFTHKVGEKVKCDICQMEFKHTGTLRKHFLRLHSERGKSFPCHLCEMSFYNQFDRKKHQELKHKISMEKKKAI